MEGTNCFDFIRLKGSISRIVILYVAAFSSIYTVDLIAKSAKVHYLFSRDEQLISYVELS